MERGASGKKHAVFYLMFHKNTFISPTIMSTFPSLNIRNIKKNKQQQTKKHCAVCWYPLFECSDKYKCCIFREQWSQRSKLFSFDQVYSRTSFLSVTNFFLRFSAKTFFCLPFSRSLNCWYCLSSFVRIHFFLLLLSIHRLRCSVSRGPRVHGVIYTIQRANC